MKQQKSSVILVFNDRGELALQLRARNDEGYPLHWDMSAAGGIASDENPKQTAIRELKEEIGVETEVELVTEILYQDEKEADYLYIYKAKYNGEFVPDGVEVEKAEFFSLDKIEAMIASGEKFHPEFLFLWNKGLIK